MQIKATLVDAVRNRQAVLFAGAGISWQAIGFGGLHIRDQLGMQIERDYPGYDYRSRSVEEVCDEYLVLNDRIALVDRLAALIPQDRIPQPSHVAAVKSFRFIVTTNWDLLFESAYRQINQHYQVLSQDADAPMFSYDQHNLLKIHGSADRPVSLVATTEDYENYAETHARLLDKVADLLQNNTVLFVGYGLRDEHVRRLLSQIRRQRQQWTRKAFAVGFFDEVRTKLLASRQIEVIDADADEFLVELMKQAGIC
ncbi:SIR2 family protein [Accumulibacter sp.]|uniref:SIR2 family NAD-dependent protein deacylase n=1 Tax=Accumulibacter sp. TaxID=2053492 RepID=UPI001AD5CEFA|nr:SIR2 family protein [Accumulibacter sp.]MBN8455859.1 SIR2 family protein [Accumulibacter sp.]MBO3705914.1 SIR2 family protein [Candidatus Accumulibacter conexus]